MSKIKLMVELLISVKELHQVIKMLPNKLVRAKCSSGTIRSLWFICRFELTRRRGKTICMRYPFVWNDTHNGRCKIVLLYKILWLIPMNVESQSGQVKFVFVLWVLKASFWSTCGRQHNVHCSRNTGRSKGYMNIIPETTLRPEACSKDNRVMSPNYTYCEDGSGVHSDRRAY